MTFSGRSEIIIIAAIAEENNVIGLRDRLPWHLPEDLKRFKKLTYGYPLVVGRRTWQGLQKQFGGPLPGRRMLVLSRKRQPGVESFATLDAALRAASLAKKVFIGGGAGVYAAALPIADRLEFTLVQGAYEGDTFFPEYEHLLGTDYSLQKQTPGKGFRFVTYHRKKP